MAGRGGIVDIRLGRNSTTAFLELDRRYKGVRNLIQNVNDRKKLLQQISKAQARRLKKNYKQMGSEYGEWASGSQVSQTLRGGRTLNRTGATYDFFASLADKPSINATSITWNFRNKFQGSDIGPNEAPHGQIVSFDDGYEFPSFRGEYLGVPARSLGEIDSEDENRAEMYIEDFISDLTKKAGFS